MSYKSKHRFQHYLRRLCIPYETAAGYLKINNVSIRFYEDFETITFRDNRLPYISFTTPYSEPSTLLYNLKRFNKMIGHFLTGHKIFNLPINLN